MLRFSFCTFSVGLSTADNLQASLVMSLLFIDERKVGAFIDAFCGFQESVTSQVLVVLDKSHFFFDISLVPASSFYF